MTTFSERLRTALNAKRISATELSRLTKIPKSAISQYLSGAFKPKQTRIYILAQALNVSEAWLMGFDVPTNKTTPATNISAHKIPVLGCISAGLPLYAEEHIESYTYTDHNGGAEYFALRVKGDSMNAAQINDGNIIIVRKQSTIENGEIAVVRVGNEDATVKRYKQDGNIVQLIPQSFNPNHQIQFYNTKETEINILGKVIECKIEFL